MKHLIFATTVFALLALTAPQKAQAANAATGTGIGIILGDPSGLSMKIPQGSRSINLILGYDLDGGCCGPGPGPGPYGDGWLYFGGDYVWYNYNLFPVSPGRLPLYYGPGAYVAVGNDDPILGVRGVVGIEYQFATAPFDLFLEIGPRINVFPNTHADAFGGFGARFFF
jgi:hypothetical protein